MKRRSSLLEQAEQVVPKRRGRRAQPHDPGELDLACAYFDGSVTGGQLGAVVGIRSTSAYIWGASVLVRGYKAGKLVRK